MIQSRLRALLLLFLALVPGGCTKKIKGSEASQACPKPRILRELSRHRELSTPGEAKLKLMWTLERVVKTTCEARRFGSYLEATVRLSVAKGPAFPEGQRTVRVPYFMIVRDPSGEILEKTTRTVTLTFEGPEASYAALVDTIGIRGLVIPTEEAFESLRFQVGLQAEPEE